MPYLACMLLSELDVDIFGVVYHGLDLGRDCATASNRLIVVALSVSHTPVGRKKSELHHSISLRPRSILEMPTKLGQPCQGHLESE